jgi:hypothetical protein
MALFHRLGTWLFAVALLHLLLPAPVRAAEADKYLLDDTDGVLTVNVRQIVDAPLFKTNYRALAQKFLKLDDVQKVLTVLGVDPLKDVDRILAVHGESSHRIDAKTGGQGGLFFIVRGRFDPAKLAAYADVVAQDNPKLLRVLKATNGTIYEVPLSQPIYIAVPEATAVVASFFKDQVSDALDKASGKKKTQLRYKDVKTLIDKADDKQGLWLLATGRMAYAIDVIERKVNGKVVEKPVKQTLTSAGIEEISGGISVTDSVKSAFSVTTKDSAAAKKVVGSLQQDLTEALEKIFAAALKDKMLDPLREFLRTLEVTADGKTVMIQGEVGAKVFEDSVK